MTPASIDTLPSELKKEVVGFLAPSPCHSISTVLENRLTHVSAASLAMTSKSWFDVVTTTPAAWCSLLIDLDPEVFSASLAKLERQLRWSGDRDAGHPITIFFSDRPTNPRRYRRDIKGGERDTIRRQMLQAIKVLMPYMGRVRSIHVDLASAPLVEDVFDALANHCFDNALYLSVDYARAPIKYAMPSIPQNVWLYDFRFPRVESLSITNVNAAVFSGQFRNVRDLRLDLWAADGCTLYDARDLIEKFNGSLETVQVGAVPGLSTIESIGPVVNETIKNIIIPAVDLPAFFAACDPVAVQALEVRRVPSMGSVLSLFGFHRLSDVQVHPSPLMSLACHFESLTLNLHDANDLAACARQFFSNVRYSLVRCTLTMEPFDTSQDRREFTLFLHLSPGSATATPWKSCTKVILRFVSSKGFRSFLEELALSRKDIPVVKLLADADSLTCATTCSEDEAELLRRQIFNAFTLVHVPELWRDPHGIQTTMQESQLGLAELTSATTSDGSERPPAPLSTLISSTATNGSPAGSVASPTPVALTTDGASTSSSSSSSAALASSPAPNHGIATSGTVAVHDATGSAVGEAEVPPAGAAAAVQNVPPGPTTTDTTATVATPPSTVVSFAIPPIVPRRTSLSSTPKPGKRVRDDGAGGDERRVRFKGG